MGIDFFPEIIKEKINWYIWRNKMNEINQEYRRNIFPEIIKEKISWYIWRNNKIKMNKEYIKRIYGNYDQCFQGYPDFGRRLTYIMHDWYGTFHNMKVKK